MLLTQEELIELTGCQKPSYQRKVLMENGVGHIVKSNGGPAVTWEAVNAAMIDGAHPSKHENDGFNLAAAL